MKILCYAPLIFHIKELKNIRPNIRKILGNLCLYQILKVIGVYLYSEYLVIHCTWETLLTSQAPLASTEADKKTPWGISHAKATIEVGKFTSVEIDSGTCDNLDIGDDQKAEENV